MAFLNDITMYWDERYLTDDERIHLRITANYICDFYHRMLAGYKPAKTSRICIYLNTKHLSKPNYFGSICQINGHFEADKFFPGSKHEQYKYLADLVHESVFRTVGIFNWNDKPFVNAHETVCSSNFLFALDYPLKKSKDGKKCAQIIINKTELKTTISLSLTIENKTDKIELLKSRNSFWYDPAYSVAKAAKWLSNDKFGAFNQKNGKSLFYSLTENSVVSEWNK